MSSMETGSSAMMTWGSSAMTRAIDTLWRSPNDGYFACWSTNGRYNNGRFRFTNAEYDAIIKEALTKTDFDERWELFAEAQMILAEEVVEIPIVFEQKNIIAYEQWSGMTAHPDGWGG